MFNAAESISRRGINTLDSRDAYKIFITTYVSFKNLNGILYNNKTFKNK